MCGTGGDADAGVPKIAIIFPKVGNYRGGGGGGGRGNAGNNVLVSLVY